VHLKLFRRKLCIFSLKGFRSHTLLASGVTTGRGSGTFSARRRHGAFGTGRGHRAFGRLVGARRRRVVTGIGRGRAVFRRSRSLFRVSSGLTEGCGLFLVRLLEVGFDLCQNSGQFSV
jgi:hypothetical protein